jgi:antitoxin component YwqK of YwqJK toxin-antitoxin module
MITLKNYLKRNLNQEEKGKFIRNVKRFKFFYKQNKDKSAFFMLLRAFDFNNSDEGYLYWNEKLKQINDVIITYHSNRKIKSIIPVLNGKTHKFCYFFNEKGNLIEIIEHSDNKCNLVYKK